MATVNKLKRNLRFSVFAVLMGLSVPVICQTQNLKWNMPTPYADGSFHTKNTRMFADEIRQSSGGRIDITVHSNGALFKLPEIKRAVQTGQVPIAETNLPAYGNEFAFFDIDSILFLDNGYDAAERLWNISKPYLDKRLNAQGITILYTVPFPGMGMISKKAVTKVEDFKGMKHRSWGPAASRFAELVGATPTVLQASELSQAFTVGIVDATLTSSTTGVATQAWEFAKYFIDLQAAHSKDTILINTPVFKALPEDLQKIILTAATNAEKRGWDWSKREGDETKARLVKEGMTILVPDAKFQAELKKIGDVLAADWEKRAGPDGVAALKKFRINTK
jgi:TRAP-type C4-dicarboxylate transport system substrate-binding protein